VRGKLLAERNCAWCHAVGQTGDSPNARAPRWRDLHKRHPIQALREPLTRGILRPHDEMPKFELTDPEIDTIVAYINSLAP
jgi:mono/diheme cytochrome c family protein